MLTSLWYISQQTHDLQCIFRGQLHQPILKLHITKLTLSYILYLPKKDQNEQNKN